MSTISREDESMYILYEREIDIVGNPSSEEISDFLHFFSPRTVEEHYVNAKITPEIIKEVIEFLPYFTRKDMVYITSSSDPKRCIYAIAEIISRIRSEQFTIRIEGVNTFSFQIRATTRGRFQEIILRED